MVGKASEKLHLLSVIQQTFFEPKMKVHREKGGQNWQICQRSKIGKRLKFILGVRK